MKLETKLITKIEKHFNYRQTTSSTEILEAVTTIDNSGLDYWRDYPHTQALLDCGVFTAFILTSKVNNTPEGVVVTSLEEEGRLWLEIIAASVESRPKGMIKLLVDLGIAIARASDARLLLVDTEQEEQYLYESHGFYQLGTISNFYPDKTDTVIMGHQIISTE